MRDPYVYPGTNILQNKLNIKDQSKLDDVENTLVNLALIKLFEEGIQITSTMDILLIHDKLFSEVYDWSGNVRSVNIHKQEMVLNGLSVRYGNHKTIQESLRNLDDDYIMLNWKKMSHTELIYNISRYISKVWQIHAFREGNTRTVSTFLYFFLLQNELDLDVELLKQQSKFFRNALVMASIGEYSEFEHIEKILDDAIIGKKLKKKPLSNTSMKYSQINNIKMDDYQYNYHHIQE
jgi:cell filamentation protein